MSRWRMCLMAVAVFACGGAGAGKPNVLLVLADDLGWSDLGCYGGEIRTPVLDGLARDGLRFTQFYNSTRCCPSRAALLTGLHPHQAGVPDMRGPLNDRCVTIPEVLRPAGYRCFMAGKWHLGGERNPIDRGFEEFYGMIGGFNSFWQEEPFYSRLPAPRSRRAYPADGFYSTDVFGDYALDFLEEGRKSGKPWFLYLAFNAPHFPLHAHEEDIARYETLYAEGWDRIRERRLARQKDLGLVPRDFTLTPRSNIPANRFNRETGWADRDNPAWDSLPADRRTDLARRMAVFAAMVDRMDRNIGRVVDRLRETGQLENTLILFLSDNGACAEWDPWGFDESSGPKNVLHTGADLKKIGGPQSYISYGSGWANACNTPWRLYKHYGHEGGVAAPFIAHWPAGFARRGEVDPRPLFITDVMSTLVEVAGATYPERVGDRAILPCEGVSLLPALRGAPAAPRVICIEHEGNRMAREGPWKLVMIAGRPWELYNVEVDRGETNDLAAREPERVKTLSAKWDAWAGRCGVQVGRPGPAAGQAELPAGAGETRCTLADRAAASSYTAPRATLRALTDGLEPAGNPVPRFTWFAHKGTGEWVQYEFPAPRRAEACRVYWYDDTPGGQIGVPESWRLLRRTGGGAWEPVSGAENPPAPRKGEWSEVTFEPAEADAFRIEVRLRRDLSAGILEWELRP